jgi:hypothetical protein
VSESATKKALGRVLNDGIHQSEAARLEGVSAAAVSSALRYWPLPHPPTCACGRCSRDSEKRREASLRRVGTTTRRIVTARLDEESPSAKAARWYMEDPKKRTQWEAARMFGISQASVSQALKRRKLT